MAYSELFNPNTAELYAESININQLVSENITANGNLTVDGSSSLQTVTATTGNFSGQVSSSSLSMSTPAGLANMGSSKVISSGASYTVLDTFNTNSGPGFLTGSVTFPSNSYFLIPRAGKYNLSASLNISSVGTGPCIVVIRINEVATGVLNLAYLDNNGLSISFSQIVNAAANDQISLALSQTTGSDLTVQGGTTIPPGTGNSFFQLFYIGN